MIARLRSLLLAGLAAGALFVVGSPGARAPLAAATAPPLTGTPTPTPPPVNATATPSPSGTVVKYSGQLLDYRNGFAFFTTGDAFRVDPKVTIDDPAGRPTQLQPAVRIYARAAFDTGNGAITELALSKSPLPQEAQYESIKRFAVALSTEAPNPELRGGPGLGGRTVLVIFTVEVPPKTPFGDTVYIATDVSQWSATALRMDRVDALHYRVSREFLSGTTFLYNYTRGSWQSSERGQDGLRVAPRKFAVQNQDVQRVTNVVYHWGDEQGMAPDLGPGAVPSPYNPLPFNTPPHR